MYIINYAADLVSGYVSIFFVESHFGNRGFTQVTGRWQSVELVEADLCALEERKCKFCISVWQLLLYWYWVGGDRPLHKLLSFGTAGWIICFHSLMPRQGLCS